MRVYETVIGLEVHVELASKSKIFCGCSTAFGGEPNAHTCPVCLAMPGTLPVLNKKVVEFAIAVGLATDCNMSRYCKFDRKNYFYPDLPKAYQISQLYLPICRDGKIQIDTKEGGKTIKIHEIHMEEDAGKLIHDQGDDHTLVDYNRGGVPLLEIVSEPDMRNAEEAIAYLEKLKLILQYLGVSDCKMQEGSLRADINLSVREVGVKEFGTRTEMKNMNSFKAITRAIEGEQKRQIEELEKGKEILQETRRWDDNKNASFSMRSKEDAKDYRYFPDADLPPIEISEEWIGEIKSREPELRDAKKARYKVEYEIPEYDADIITSSKKLADIFEETVAICKDPKEVSNWLMVETMRMLREEEKDAEEMIFSPINLAKLITLIKKKEINRTVAKEIFESIFKEDINPEKYVEEKGLKLITEERSIRPIIERVIEENAQSVIDYKGGKEKALGFLIGQAMKATKGQGDPAVINKILMEKLTS